MLLLAVALPFVRSASVCEGEACQEALEANNDTAYLRGDLIKVWARIQSWDGDEDPPVNVVTNNATTSV
jgi:hypothetical protein